MEKAEFENPTVNRVVSDGVFQVECECHQKKRFRSYFEIDKKGISLKRGKAHGTTEKYFQFLV
jgi:hypothetical protein